MRRFSLNKSISLITTTLEHLRDVRYDCLSSLWEVVMEMVRWGILGTARINRKIIPAFQASDLAEVHAVASRSEERARQAAETYGLARHYGSYEALLSDRDIDAVYIPLPNHLHLPWSLNALDAGKHVLCEKPVGMDADEAEQLQKASLAHPGLKVMEAFMYRFHPQWLQTRQWVREGVIGELRNVHTLISYFKDAPDDIRNVPSFGGGGLMDIGCYGVSVARFLYDQEPQRVFGAIQFDPKYNVDRLASVTMDFETGLASFSIGTQIARYQRVQILGTEGRIELEVPFNAPPDKPCRLILQQDMDITVHDTEVRDQYTEECDAFCTAVLNDTPVPTPLQDAVNNMRVLDRVKQSARTGTWS